jgi:tetratricopeptide (TPR) repeat protein
MSGLGQSYFAKGEVKNVFKVGEAALDYGQSHNSLRCLVVGHLFKGVGYFMDRNLPSVIECMKQAIEISADPAYTQVGRFGLGMGYTMNGQFQEAKDILQQVIIFCDKFGFEYWGTQAKLYLGVALMAQGHMDQGLKIIEGAQRSFEKNEEKTMYMQSEYILGNIYLQMVEKAAPVKLATVVKNMGFLAKNVPFAAKKAENHFNKAIEVCREIGAKGFMGMAYLDLGTLHRAKGNKPMARECLSKAIELFEQCELENYLKQAREALVSLE